MTHNPEWHRNKVAERRRLLLGGQVCSRCGFDDPRALEFHHRNPEEKIASVASMLASGWERLMREVAKCDIICANCHAIEHALVMELADMPVSETGAERREGSTPSWGTIYGRVAQWESGGFTRHASKVRVLPWSPWPTSVNGSTTVS